MDWTQEDIQLLRQLRAAGLSYDEIAAALHRSTAAIGTKARQLKLPARHYVPTPPQPKRGPAHRVRLHIPRAGKTTLPPLPSLG
jgi:hypothetical protein